MLCMLCCACCAVAFYGKPVTPVATNLNSVVSGGTLAVCHAVYAVRYSSNIEPGSLATCCTCCCLLWNDGYPVAGTLDIVVSGGFLAICCAYRAVPALLCLLRCAVHAVLCCAVVGCDNPVILAATYLDSMVLEIRWQDAVPCFACQAAHLNVSLSHSREA